MKKYYIGALAGVAALSLAACSDTATPVEGTKDQSNQTLEEVFNKALERQLSINSVKANIEMEQNTTMTVDGEEITMSSSTNMDMTGSTKPLAFFVDGTMSMDMFGGTDPYEMPLKMYFSEDEGFYMFDEMSEGWVKLPNDAYKEMLAQAGVSMDATEQLEQLKPFISDFIFEQNDDSYILTLNASGEKFADLINEQIENSLGQSFGEEELDFFEGINYENAKFILTIDKKTFDTKKVLMDLDMTMEVEGMKALIQTKSTINYSDFDKVDAIKIPKDVIENAVEADYGSTGF